MKKIVFLFVGVIVVTMFFSTGCTNKGADVADSITADTLLEDTTANDTLSQIIEEEIMPAAADELFDDFFFNYAASRKVQKERTVFPLPVNSWGKLSKIEEKAWKREHFFMRQGYYTLIFHRASQMNMVKDTTVNEVTVEKIVAGKNMVTRWHFARKRGLWHMDSLTYMSLGKHEDAGFIRFYQRFATDSAFQQHSLAESIAFTGPDPDDDFSTMTGEIMPEQWSMFVPWMPSGTLYNIIYGSSPYPVSNTRLLYVRGIANGLQMDMVFTRKGKSWILKKVNT